MPCGKGKEREEESGPPRKRNEGKRKVFLFRKRQRKRKPARLRRTERKEQGKGKWNPFGKGNSEGGKSFHTGKGKDRIRCWKCGHHGRFEKDCKNVAAVTEENEELYDENDWTNDVTEYNDEDWMDWTEHIPTTGIMVLTMTGHSYTGTMTQTGMTRYDNWTWSSGSDSVGPSALSQPQQPAASSSTAASSTSFTGAQPGAAPPPNLSALPTTVNVTDLETGETLTHPPSRRTGTVTRPVRTGTGLLSSFVSVIAVMNSFGRPQGLPLIPETASYRGVPATDEYDDLLGRHHENCISSLSTKKDWILFDSGAAAHCCPLDYAPDYPLLPVGKNPPRLRSVTGKPLHIIGRKLIRYDAVGVRLFTKYYVCDVPFCIVSVA